MPTNQAPIDWSTFGQYTSPQSMMGGANWTPPQDFSFAKRSDALSAGVPDWTDTLKGYGQSVSDMLPGGFLGSTDTKTGIKTDGWGGTALGVANGLFSGYMGMKQFGLSKDIFNNNKQQFERNFAAQKGVTNSQLSDRQDRRNADAAFNGRSATSTADYMKKYGVA